MHRGNPNYQYPPTYHQRNNNHNNNNNNNNNRHPATGMQYNNNNYNRYNNNYTPQYSAPYNPALINHHYSPNYTINNTNNSASYNYTTPTTYTNNIPTTSTQFKPEGSGTGRPLLEQMKADARTLLVKPGRDSRHKKIVIILRGLPGSGKTHYAKIIKDYEVKYGGTSPRIFCIDDYFMAEVDKEEEDPETGIKRKVKGVEYKYEQEMEEAYGASLFKAFRKCLTEGFFPFIIVDNINVYVRDFESYCVAANAAGYEVYILQMPTYDLKLLAQRNVHKRTLEDIQKMSSEWEEAPYRYTLLDIDTIGNPSTDEITVVDMLEEDSDDNVEQKDEASERAKAVSESKWAKLNVEHGKDKMEKEKEKENENENEKEGAMLGKVKVESEEEKKEKEDGYEDSDQENDVIEVVPKETKPIKSIVKKNANLEGGAKKVKWADFETQKELERSGAFKRKRLESDSTLTEEDGENPNKLKKEGSFLDKIREEQESFKVLLIAKQALEKVKYIPPREIETSLEEDLNELG